jgi:hypothetical protein
MGSGLISVRGAELNDDSLVARAACLLADDLGPLGHTRDPNLLHAHLTFAISSTTLAVRATGGCRGLRSPSRSIPFSANFRVQLGRAADELIKRPYGCDKNEAESRRI